MSDYKKLQERYKILFEYKEDSREPFALFGFECGEGWYNIIENACHAICSDYEWESKRLEMLKECLKDISGITKRRSVLEINITEDVVRKEVEESIDNTSIQVQKLKSRLPRIVQVKEKFGTLRIYMDNNSPEFKHVEMYAELMSAVTCEKCGNVGRTYRVGWHQTLCREHAIERYGEKVVSDYELDKKEVLQS